MGGLNIISNMEEAMTYHRHLRLPAYTPVKTEPKKGVRKYGKGE